MKYYMEDQHNWIYSDTVEESFLMLCSHLSSTFELNGRTYDQYNRIDNRSFLAYSLLPVLFFEDKGLDHRNDK
jgi:hypothetical protein